MLQNQQAEQNGAQCQGRPSEVSARETKVTIAIIEASKPRAKQTSITVWCGRALVVVLGIMLIFGLWKVTHVSDLKASEKATNSDGVKPRQLARVPLTPEQKEGRRQRRAVVATWNIKYDPKCPASGRDIRLHNYQEVLQRILKDFKAKYPEKFESLPFDIEEHFAWKARHNRFDARDNELALYSMLYHDWSTNTEDTPLDKLLYGRKIARRGDAYDGPKKSYGGSKVEDRAIPDSIIQAFSGTDATTRVAKRIFDAWEGRTGETRLCVEDCALRLGLVRLEENCGSFCSLTKNGAMNFRDSEIHYRVNMRFYKELIRNDAFRNYLDWKGLRNRYSGGYGTLVCDIHNEKKSMFEHVYHACDTLGMVVYTSSPPFGKSTRIGRAPSPHHLDHIPHAGFKPIFSDTAYDISNWPTIKFETS